MKKALVLLLSALLLSSMLTGCGENTESQISGLLTDSTTQGEVVSDSENEELSQPKEELTTTLVEETEALSQTKEGLNITLNGENEVTITLNDVTVGELNKNAESNLRIFLQGEGASEFERESELYISSNSWNLLHFTDKDTGKCQIIVNGSSEGFFSETSCTFSINRIGISSYFDNIEHYKILFTDANKENLQTTVASGKLSDVLSTDASELHTLQVMFPDDETIRIKVYGEEAKTSFYNYENIRICIYESEEQINADNPYPSLELIADTIYQEVGNGRIYAVACSQDGNRSGQVLEDDTGSSDGRTLGTDYGVVMQYSNERIREYVKPEYFYELYFGNDKMEIGRISDIFVANEYPNIPAIPKVFPVNAKDDDYFTPATDNYIVTMVTYPVIPFFDFGFGRDQGGNPIYEAKSNHMSSMKIIKMTSFDEFGIVDERSKTVYDNDADAMSAFCNRQTWLDARGLQLNETMDDPVIIKLFDTYSEDYFASKIQAGEYLGRFDNVTYFIDNVTFGNYSLTSELIPLENPTYDSDGMVTMDYPYEYDFADLSRGHSFIMDNTGTLVQYASRTNATALNYEEEREKYNTASSTWQDHPYISYLPELPSGVTVDYIEGSTINDTNLALHSEINCCTREQAEDFIEAFENMKYENEIAEQRYKVDDDYEYSSIRHLEGHIRILISWRVEEQRLCIYVNKD